MIATVKDISNQNLEPSERARIVNDRAACGFGLVARRDGKATHNTLRKVLSVLPGLEHRGGRDTEGTSSDGMGLLVDVDQDFYKEKYEQYFPPGFFFEDKATYNEKGRKRSLAVGNVFLPRGDEGELTDRGEICARIFKDEFEKAGYYIRERHPGFKKGTLGRQASKTHPKLTQFAIAKKVETDAKGNITYEQTDADFDLDMYIIRKRIEKKILNGTDSTGRPLSGEGHNHFHICSLSQHDIVFKSLSLAHQLRDVYRDLHIEANALTGLIYKTAKGIFHRRFSTNTAPSWARAHPNRTMVHNGEINSLIANLNMKDRMEKIIIQLYGDERAQELWDVVIPGGTDSAALDNFVEFMLHAGFTPPAIKAVLIPEVVHDHTEMSEDARQMYEYVDALVGPWDGPAGYVISGNGEIMIGNDRNGLRPVRIVESLEPEINEETGEQENVEYIYAASEDGINQELENKHIKARKNIKPGGSYTVSQKEGRVIEHAESRERAAQELQVKLGYKEKLKQINPVSDRPSSKGDYLWTKNKNKLRRRQRLGAFDQGAVDFINKTAANGKEPLGSMGDDAPETVASKVYRTFQNFFRQRFAQVSNPPIDSIRERLSMSLRTHLGSFYYELGTDAPYSKVHRLESPIVNTATHKALRAMMEREGKVVEINCTYDIKDPKGLEKALERIQLEAAMAARGGKHIFLTDEHTNEGRAAIPMLLASGAVNTHLNRINNPKGGLREQTSINVRTSQAFNSHDIAALIGLGGADTVNAYVTEETIAASHAAGLYDFQDIYSSFNREISLETFLNEFVQTGDAEIDAQSRKMLDAVLRHPGAQEFIEAHNHMSLQELATHNDPRISSEFLDILKSLKVSVHKLYDGQSLDYALNSWKTATDNGLLKIMAKMGISHVNSYRGGRLFECLGLSRSVVKKFFPGVPSKLGGLSLEQIQQRETQHHEDVFGIDPSKPLEHKGRYAIRVGKGAEKHVMTPELIELFQDSIKERTQTNAFLDEYIPQILKELRSNDSKTILDDDTIKDMVGGVLHHMERSDVEYEKAELDILAEFKERDVDNILSFFLSYDSYLDKIREFRKEDDKDGEKDFVNAIEDPVLRYYLKNNPKKLAREVGRIKDKIFFLLLDHDEEEIKAKAAAAKQKDFEVGFEKHRKYREKLIRHTQKHRFNIRDWLGFKSNKKNKKPKQSYEERAERRKKIKRLFFTGAMSDGSIGKEAHETPAEAMNHPDVDGASNSGEGGEHPSRFGTEFSSKYKQMASSRFGAYLDYILDADVVQIKIAQGAKPGEGGELLGYKVKARVAFLRNCTEGTTLVSPAPHHDIYSIEDIEQLIYDLKQIKPELRVNVKLVASEGVDTIAVGVAKAGADEIDVAGFNGGSGASPQLSFAHAGMPWEAFVNRVHDQLIQEGFRGKVKLRNDGGLRIGRDIVIAAMMGSEGYGFGLQALIAEGCKLLRDCHNGTCAYGLAATDEELRKKFGGEAYMIRNMMDFIAEDVLEILDELGFDSLEEIIGRADLLEQVWGKDLGLDFTEILPGAKRKDLKKRNVTCTLGSGERNNRIDPVTGLPENTLDNQIWGNWGDHFWNCAENGGRYVDHKRRKIINENRTVGTHIGAKLRRKMIEEFRKAGGRDIRDCAQMQEDTIRLKFDGSAGQSFGAFLAEGVTLDLIGAAQDGVGKSLSGGKIVIKQDRRSSMKYNSQDQATIGNAALYGAISGELYVAGQAGHRFGIRLSGATAVVEGAGSYACNYMTNGTAVILGEVGENFGSGMSGGEAFVYDENDRFKHMVHKDIKSKVSTIDDQETKDRLKAMVIKHFKETGSKHARSMLEDWDNAVQNFKHVNAKSPGRTKGADVTIDGSPSEGGRPITPEGAEQIRLAEAETKDPEEGGQSGAQVKQQWEEPKVANDNDQGETVRKLSHSFGRRRDTVKSHRRRHAGSASKQAFGDDLAERAMNHG